MVFNANMLAINVKPNKVKVRVFRHYISISILLLILFEIIIFASSYYLGVFLCFGTDVDSKMLQIEPLLYSFIMIASISTQGLYRVRYRQTYFGIFKRICVSFIMGLAVLMSLLYMLYPSMLYFDGLVIIYSHAVSFMCVCIVHIYFFSTIDRSKFKSKTLVFGAGRNASSLSKLRRKADLRNFTIVGYVKCNGDNLNVVPDKLVNIDLDDLKPYIVSNNINEILVAPDDRRLGLPIQQLLDCKMHGVNIVDLCSFFEREAGKIRLDLLHPSWLIFSDGFKQGINRAFFKRMMDLSLSILFIFLSIPIMFFVALGILIDSNPGENILYRQTRIGLNGKYFEIIKFRSMVANAEKNGAEWAQKGDQRITRIGKFIRKYRIDELPQLFNVLMGDMSLVGPRPERPEFVKILCESIPYYNERHRVKPGITGWAQLNYPYGSSVEDSLEKSQYDLYYVKNNSLFLDISILLQTAEVVLFKKGSR